MKPILFKPEMVRAILNGRKTQTRRFLSKSGISGFSDGIERYEQMTDKEGKVCLCDGYDAIYPKRQKGDVLWVRETWAGHLGGYLYKATPDKNVQVKKWKPAIHMPYAACRLWLEVVNVRVEKLQDISESDAYSEGATPLTTDGSYKCGFMALWDKINGKGSWKQNPYVEVVVFKIKEAKNA